MRNEVVPHAGGVRSDRLASSEASRGAASPVGSVAAVVMCAAAGLACAGSGRTQVAIGPPPPRETHAVLAGALCQDNHCSCRSDGPGDGGVGYPDTGRKRYEIRMTS